jgi:hypothetical protein
MIAPSPSQRRRAGDVGRLASGAGLALAALLGGVSAGAEPAHTARLSYTLGRGAEQCPDEQTVRAAVAERLGYDPFQPGARRLVTATVRRAGGSLRGEVNLRDARGAVSGTRQLTATDDDCVELVTAMALAISLAIDPTSLPRPPAPVAPPAGGPAPSPGGEPAPRASPAPSAPSLPSTPPPPAPPPAVAPPVVAAPRPVVVPAAAPRPSLRIGVGGVFAAGTEPGLTGGFTLLAGIRRGALSGSFEGRADLPASVRATGGGTVSASLLSLTIVPCAHLGLAVVCALGSVGALRGSGAGVAQPKDDATLYGAAGIRAGVEVPLGARLSAAFHGDVAVTLARATLELEQRPVWTAPPASAALGAGILAHFP